MNNHKTTTQLINYLKKTTPKTTTTFTNQDLDINEYDCYIAVGTATQTYEYPNNQYIKYSEQFTYDPTKNDPEITSYTTTPQHCDYEMQHKFSFTIVDTDGDELDEDMINDIIFDNIPFTIDYSLLETIHKTSHPRYFRNTPYQYL